MRYNLQEWRVQTTLEALQAAVEETGAAAVGTFCGQGRWPTLFTRDIEIMDRLAGHMIIVPLLLSSHGPDRPHSVVYGTDPHAVWKIHVATLTEVMEVATPEELKNAQARNLELKGMLERDFNITLEGSLLEEVMKDHGRTAQ